MGRWDQRLVLLPECSFVGEPGLGFRERVPIPPHTELGWPSIAEHGLVHFEATTVISSSPKCPSPDRATEKDFRVITFYG